MSTALFVEGKMNPVSVRIDGKALTRLVEIIADGTGFTGRGMRKNAEANRDIRLLEAQTNKDAQAISDGLLEYRNGNLKKVAELAHPLLNKVDDPKIEDLGWFGDWLNKASNTSDVNVQDWWAKILAGEAEQNGSYSKWALDAVSKMSKDDIHNFTLLSTCLWSIGIVAWRDWTRELLGYSELVLERAGLVDVDVTEAGRRLRKREWSTWRAGAVTYFGQELTLKVDSKGGLPVGHVELSLLGRELIGLCDASPNEEYKQRCIQMWRERGLLTQ